MVSLNPEVVLSAVVTILGLFCVRLRIKLVAIRPLFVTKAISTVASALRLSYHEDKHVIHVSCTESNSS